MVWPLGIYCTVYTMFHGQQSTNNSHWGSNTTLLCYRKIRRHTYKKDNQIFLIYKEIQSGAVAKSYMRKSLLIYEEIRKYFPMYEEPVSHIWLCHCSILKFLKYEENLIFFFISASPCILAKHAQKINKKPKALLSSLFQNNINIL